MALQNKSLQKSTKTIAVMFWLIVKTILSHNYITKNSQNKYYIKTNCISVYEFCVCYTCAYIQLWSNLHKWNIMNLKLLYHLTFY